MTTNAATRQSAFLKKLVFDMRAFKRRWREQDTYKYLKKCIVEKGGGINVTRSERETLVRQFERIDLEVPMASTPTDGLFLAAMLLNTIADGDIVECGCYLGGSTSKLSLLAKLLNRKLYVFDSFEGLPESNDYFLRDQHCRRSETWVSDWTKGRYAAQEEQVRTNVGRHGAIDTTYFIKGWFNQTLDHANLPEQISLAFVDVDLASSARDCLLPIWPRIQHGGVYVTHDTSYIKVLQETLDPELWRNSFQSTPPILFGAGFGLCNESPHLGYMVKGDNLEASYLKSLTIDK